MTSRVSIYEGLTIFFPKAFDLSLDPLKWARRLLIRTHQLDQEDSVAVLRNTKFREWPRLLGGVFRRLIWENLILSLLNKVCINSGVIKKHGGGVFDG